MKMTTFTEQELAAFDAAMAAMDDAAEAAEMDKEFDAGEFSGPAHDRALAKTFAEIAERFGLTADRLDEIVLIRSNELMKQDIEEAIANGTEL